MRESTIEAAASDPLVDRFDAEIEQFCKLLRREDWAHRRVSCSSEGALNLILRPRMLPRGHSRPLGSQVEGNRSMPISLLPRRAAGNDCSDRRRVLSVVIARW